MTEIPKDKVVELLETLVGNITKWQDHEARDTDFVTKAESEGQATAYAHVAGGLSIITGFIRQGSFDLALKEAQDFANDIDADEDDDEKDEQTMACDECGQAMLIDSGGVSHHLTEEGEVDHDKDADHVALNKEAVDGDVGP